MGKYLDIARRFEEKGRAEGRVPSPRLAAPPRPRTVYQELEDATPPGAALEVFQDWAGLLVKSSVLEMSVWIVRSRQDGEELARETGHPGLLLDDVLRQKGRTPEEARASLLPVLITGVVQ